ncbi:hypothetical protein FFLO_02338 [Filobasidium floriforme]|uniref:Uncharacterized protein n=2 Tax=Filobasidium floriforme TaxID=5210 RepID=A0A8K0JNJ2_9TREE|nr:hypothetical protein FFLO_02338 [Filobasidium floriforme]
MWTFKRQYEKSPGDLIDISWWTHQSSTTTTNITKFVAEATSMTTTMTTITSPEEMKRYETNVKPTLPIPVDAEPWPAPNRSTSKRYYRTYLSLENLAVLFYVFSAGCLGLAIWCGWDLIHRTGRYRSGWGFESAWSNAQIAKLGWQRGGETAAAAGVGSEGYYRYIVALSIPVCAWIAIAHWIGWQFYLYSDPGEDTKT